MRSRLLACAVALILCALPDARGLTLRRPKARFAAPAVAAAVSAVARQKALATAVSTGAVDVSLGHSVIPSLHTPFYYSLASAAGAAAAKAAALAKSLLLPVALVAAVATLLKSGALDNAAKAVPNLAGKLGSPAGAASSLLSSLVAAAQGLLAAAGGALGAVRSAVPALPSLPWPQGDAPVDPLEWFACTLQSSSPVGAGADGRSEDGNPTPWLRYRFKVKDSNAALPVELGQGVTLCGLDDGDRVVRVDLPLLSPRSTRGHFDVLVRDDGFNNPMAEVLRSLEKGDEIAAKLGPQRLTYEAEYQPVTGIVALCEAEGIVPVVQISKELLKSRSSTSVDSLNVVWVNGREDDFVLYKDVEKLFYKHPRQVDVSCVLEPEAAQGDLQGSAAVFEATPTWEPGCMAIVAGSPAFAAGAKQFLMDVAEFPPDTICSL